MDHIDFLPVNTDGTPMAGTLRITSEGCVYWSGDRAAGFARMPSADFPALAAHLAGEAPTCHPSSAVAPTQATPPIVGMGPIRTGLPHLPRSRGAHTKERP